MYSIISKPLAQNDPEDEEVEFQLSMLEILVKNTAFLMIQNIFEFLFQKEIPIPSDVEKRLNIRVKNVQKTGKIGINEEGIDIF